MERGVIQLSHENAAIYCLAAIAHEISQPLTALTLFLQSAKRSNIGNGDVDRLLDKALLEVERCSAAIQSARKAMESGVRTGRTNLGEALKLARGAVKCEWPGARVAVNVDDDAVIDLSAETAVYLLSAEITQSIATLRTTEVQTLRVRAKRDGDGFTVRMTCGVRRASGGTLPAFKGFADSDSPTVGLMTLVSTLVARECGARITHSANHTEVWLPGARH